MAEQHKELLQGLAEQMQSVFDSSTQGMYLFLDDAHKVCNKKFASLLGYSSPAEWALAAGSFTALFVAEKSQQELVTTYQKAMQKMAGSTINVTWKKKSSGTVDTTVILVPVAYSGHVFALHFVM